MTANGQPAAGSANVNNNWQIEPVASASDSLLIRRTPEGVRFRIGPPRNGFLYGPSDLTFQGNPVYQCLRGSQAGLPSHRVYWLYRCSSGCWICLEADAHSDHPIADGSPQFKTESASIDDISVECDRVAWQHWDEVSGMWSAAVMMFPTTRLFP